MPSLQGHFLIASPQLNDGNFARSVVLLVQHNAEGALGVVLNRPSGSTVADVWREAVGEPCDCTSPVYVGGPCEGPLMAVHGQPASGGEKVIQGVWFTADGQELRAVVAGDGPFRLFSGYSGWGGGQLDGELKVGGWLHLPATKELVFGDDEILWERLTREIG
ncbi:MAG: YqgE/AlgH family protein, partial [Planctomycetales bacterium]|nr:YqgE/AlgH family protein [Planctomycetales bacterium]